MNKLSFLRRAMRSIPPAVCAIATLGAAASGASASTIHACVKPRSGATRIVGAKSKCHRGEKKLAWATSGTPGPKGATGLTGAAGAEGKAGADGSTLVLAAEDENAQPLTTSPTTLVSKVLPPGSYSVSAKTVLVATAKKQEEAAALCGLVDQPGTAGAGTGSSLDVDVWSSPLSEREPADFLVATPIPFEGTITSQVTSTLELACVSLTAGPAVVGSHSRLQALTMTRIG